MTTEVEKNEQIEVKGLHEKVDVRTKDLIKDEKILVEMFNKHYISTIHPNIIKMKEIVKEKPIFDFPESTAEDINKIIKSLNPNKATGPDHIPLKIIKTAANVIDSHLAHIINKDLKENKFSENVYLFIRKMIGVKVKTIDESVF